MWYVQRMLLKRVVILAGAFILFHMHPSSSIFLLGYDCMGRYLGCSFWSCLSSLSEREQGRETLKILCLDEAHDVFKTKEKMEVMAYIIITRHQRTLYAVES